MCFSAIAAIGSAVVGSRGASKAADATEQASRDQLAVQERVYEETTGRFAPFYDSGLNYQNALNFELLGGERPMIGPSGLSIEEIQTRGPSTTTYAPDRGLTSFFKQPGELTTTYGVGGQVFDTREAAQQYLNSQGTPYEGFKATPGYEFRVNEGQRGIEGTAAANGNYFSGNTLKAVEGFRQNMASQEYGNFLNRLTAGASGGQAAAANQANAGANFASGASNALANIGEAQAAGYVGQANAINGGISNALGAFGYGQATNSGSSNFAPPTSFRPQARPWG